MHTEGQHRSSSTNRHSQSGAGVYGQLLLLLLLLLLMVVLLLVVIAVAVAAVVAVVAVVAVFAVVAVAVDGGAVVGRYWWC